MSCELGDIYFARLQIAVFSRMQLHVYRVDLALNPEGGDMPLSSLRDYYSGDTGCYNHGIPSGFSLRQVSFKPARKKRRK